MAQPQLAHAAGDSVYIESLHTAVAHGANKVAVTGFNTSEVGVYDLRDPERPVRLLTTEAVVCEIKEKDEKKGAHAHRDY